MTDKKLSVKEKVLRALAEGSGSPVSGEALASKLGVTRAAVWKAVKALRESGYPIESGTNRGYTLTSGADILTGEAVSALMREDIPVYYFDKVGSTNEKAKEIVIGEGAETGLVVADCQTAGKGRLGRTFVSPAGSGIYMSLISQPDFDLSRSVLVTTAAAVAVCKALEDLYDLRPQIKWVNDVYLDGKKITGILTEALTDFESGQIERIIVGIGINCFENSAAKDASDAYGFIGGNISRARIAAKVIDYFAPMLRDLDSREFIDDYRKRCLVTGKDVLVYKAGTLGRPDARPLRARAVGIDDNGGLIIEHDGRRESLTSGEVSVRPAE
ncbi:MAG: biotin--[acetyl-CoA-carboxylase] ligase [Anaerovoracaceae bacterium]